MCRAGKFRGLLLIASLALFAVAFSVVTENVWLPPPLPGVKPTATRAGMSIERSIAAIVPANCSQ